jgi:hypothetical protein
MGGCCEEGRLMRGCCEEGRLVGWEFGLGGGACCIGVSGASWAGGGGGFRVSWDSRGQAPR